jgi:hypothetical protein
MGASAPIRDQKLLKNFHWKTNRDKKFSTTPSDPHQKFSTDPWHLGPGSHAGEIGLLLDKYPTVG